VKVPGLESPVQTFTFTSVTTLPPVWVTNRWASFSALSPKAYAL